MRSKVQGQVLIVAQNLVRLRQICGFGVYLLFIHVRLIFMTIFRYFGRSIDNVFFNFPLYHPLTLSPPRKNYKGRTLLLDHQIDSNIEKMTLY